MCVRACVRACVCVRVCVCVWTHRTASVDARPLHGDGDAVQEDDDQDYVVKHLVGDDPVTDNTEPANHTADG